MPTSVAKNAYIPIPPRRPKQGRKVFYNSSPHEQCGPFVPLATLDRYVLVASFYKPPTTSEITALAAARHPFHPLESLYPRRAIWKFIHIHYTIGRSKVMFGVA